MSNQAERDPAEGIIDIETFGLWVVGYKAHALANTERVVAKQVTITKEEYEDLFEGDPALIDPPAHLSLRACLWDEVPFSTQANLMQQYPSATLEGEKLVDVGFQDRRLTFQLNSPWIRRNVDTYGETEVPRHGLFLQIRDGKFITGMPMPRGNWGFTNLPPNVRDERLEPNTDYWDIFIKRVEIGAAHPPELVLATIDELKDVARFLTRSSHRAHVSSVKYLIQ